MDLFRNDWKHILKNETDQKSLFKTFCNNKQGSRKMKDSQKPSNKEIYLNLITLTSNQTLIKPFKGAEAT